MGDAIARATQGLVHNGAAAVSWLIHHPVVGLAAIAVYLAGRYAARTIRRTVFGVQRRH